jgi:hypothetical protein
MPRDVDQMESIAGGPAASGVVLLQSAQSDVSESQKAAQCCID